MLAEDLGLAAEAMFGVQANTLAALFRATGWLPDSRGKRPRQEQAATDTRAHDRNVRDKETV
jgi:hypothetical protein